MTTPATHYSDWHIPLSRQAITLAEALQSLSRVGAAPQEVPLMVRLVENPAFKLPGFTLFHGAVNLETHDAIHILLGRGLLPEDEAFTIGYTMGSTKKVAAHEKELFALISKYLYPAEYKFNQRCIQIFKDAVHLAQLSACQALDSIDFNRYLSWTLDDVRRELGIEIDLLKAYFNIEKNRYPDSPGSQRLLD